MVIQLPSHLPRNEGFTLVGARLLAIILLALVLVLLGSTYVGHASSPYGVCFGKSGRTIPCAVLGK